MPELPEVEVVCRGLRPLLKGRTLGLARASGYSLRLPVPHADLQRWTEGVVVVAVRRRGKYLIIDLENHAKLIFHLGMTGRLGVIQGNAPLAAHDHLCIRLGPHHELRFNDTRRFGLVQVLDPGQDEVEYFSALGPEPLLDDFSASYLMERGASRRQPIKNFLMDSRVVVGIGNIYASEILHGVKISPVRPTNQVSLAEWRRVVEHTRRVLRRAIAAGGSTIADFVSASGKPGFFQLELKVYGRQGQSCPRCGAVIIKEALAGRSTFYCGGCQR